VIVGAGIVGAACAAALTGAKLTVTVLESGTVGGGATAAGMGHIVVMDDNEPEFALTKLSRDLWDALVPSLPGNVEYERRGTLWIAADEEEFAAVRFKHAYYAARGVRTEILDSGALHSAEPGLRAGLAGGLLVGGDAVIYSPCAALWFLRQAQAGGASLLNAEVLEFTADGVRLADGASISAGHVICAAGAETVRFFPEIPIRPRKGHLAITSRYPGFVHHQLVELGYLKSAHGVSNESVAFNIQPRATGQVLIGSSRQFDVTSPSIDARILRRMLRRSLEYMPGLASLSVIRTWTGFRAATPDKLPVIGPHPGNPRLWFATGHEGLGITTSTGTARLVAAGIAGHAPAIPAEPYLPARFLEKPHAPAHHHQD
jgi:glycine/D-amino acid oxidase-like deaminating enzyme